MYSPGLYPGQNSDFVWPKWLWGVLSIGKSNDTLDLGSVVCRIRRSPYIGFMLMHGRFDQRLKFSISTLRY